jgi:hypothetical protein
MNGSPRKSLVAIDVLLSGVVLTLVLSLVIATLSFVTSTPAVLPGLFATRSSFEGGAMAVEISLGWNGIVVVATLGAIARLPHSRRGPDRLRRTDA